MAKKYEQPYPETQELYTQAINDANLAQFVNITILSNNKAKEIFKVAKCSETENFKTGDDINIFVNEKVLDGLTPEQRLIVVEESIASISFDSENDKIVISKPDVVTFSGILSKHSFETWNVLRESIKTLYAAEKQAEDESKAATAKN
jgi:hypothetical protein